MPPGTIDCTSLDSLGQAMPERPDHPTRELPPDSLVHGNLQIRIYGPPQSELARTVGDRVAHWVSRLYQSYGADPSNPPLSASMEAVAEAMGHRLEGLSLILRKAEARGWKTSVDDDMLVIYTGIAEDEVRAQLEEDGVLSLVQEFAMRDVAQTGEG
ncbi:MAG: hypothetical protein QOK05_2320 [Chloroflexota bacterium]|jgi:hypothetical protein|nr:hypothetical protein [Chloroflexota bacterium]